MIRFMGFQDHRIGVRLDSGGLPLGMILDLEIGHLETGSAIGIDSVHHPVTDLGRLKMGSLEEDRAALERGMKMKLEQDDVDSRLRRQGMMNLEDDLVSPLEIVSWMQRERELEDEDRVRVPV
jgi:hypothetical protein